MTERQQRTYEEWPDPQPGPSYDEAAANQHNAEPELIYISSDEEEDEEEPPVINSVSHENLDSLSPSTGQKSSDTRITSSLQGMPAADAVARSIPVVFILIGLPIRMTKTFLKRPMNGCTALMRARVIAHVTTASSLLLPLHKFIFIPLFESFI